MRRTLKLLLLLLCVAAPAWHCVQKYNSPYVSPPTGYLVAEGYITGNGPTHFTLSRTVALSGDSANPMETGAKVQIEGNDNTIYPLTEQSTGIYGADTLALNTAAQYRLRISTAGGEQYLSSFVPYKPTPPIDSVSWSYNSNGVQIYATTHDPVNATRYYQWEYGETWEYHSGEESTVEYVVDTVIARPDSNEIFTCWHADSSNTIIVGSSAKLAQDVIYEHPVTTVPVNSQQLSVLYSLFVRQYALTEDGYNFLTLMQANTESLGTIFDAQPSQLTGNIQCLTNPSEPVVGWVSAGTVQTQRIFINRFQIPNSFYSFSCPMKDTLVAPDSTMYPHFYVYGDYIPVRSFYSLSGYLLGYYSNYAGCVDCRLQGGTNQKPFFWPN